MAELNIKIELKDNKLQELSFKCFSYDITIAELISGLISDLLGGKDAGGSDERIYVSNWFYRRYESEFISAQSKFDELFNEKLIQLTNQWLESPDAFGYGELHEYLQKEVGKKFESEYGFNPCDLIDEWVEDYCSKKGIDYSWSVEQKNAYCNSCDTIVDNVKAEDI